MQLLSFKTIYNLWEIWDVRVLILFSFFLQFLLIFAAPLRKRTSCNYVLLPIWLAYVLADAIANFAVGIISKSQNQHDTEPSGLSVHPDLLALWAALLLVHLGGPDTITALALEDNELWLRHLLQLAYQCAATVYVFIITLPKSKLQLPTLLMFMCGFIKYTERTRSLYLASTGRFQRSLRLPSHVVENSLKDGGKEQAGKQAWEDKSQNLEPLEVIKQAHRFFGIFKGLRVDLSFSSDVRDNIRLFFLNRNARDCIRVLEVELNFFYEILYTKASVMQGKYGYLLRLLSLTLNIVAFGIFYVTDKMGFQNFDIGITYCLLLGAIVLDMIAFVMTLFSDWHAVALAKLRSPPLFIRILVKLLNVNKKRWHDENSNKHCPCSFGWSKEIVDRRWSKSICQFNLIQYCLHPRSKLCESLISKFGLTTLLDGLKYVDTVEFPDALGDFIFEELRLKAREALNLQLFDDIYSSRGEWVLKEESCDHLLAWISNVTFDNSILIWHVATEICLHTETSTKDDPEDGNAVNNKKGSGFHRFSYLLSNYMLYLLVMHSTMMSVVTGIGLIRFKHTCKVAKRVFRRRLVNENLEKHKEMPWFWSCFSTGNKKLQRQEACESIHTIDAPSSRHTNEEKHGGSLTNNRSDGSSSHPYMESSGGRSVLSEARTLAEELNSIGERKWKIMNRVWVEMLSYAACRCKGPTHVAQLGKGGQVISNVWLLMAHFGFGTQLKISQDIIRSHHAVERSKNIRKRKRII